MAGLTDEWERIVLDILFGPTAYGVAGSGSVPETWYVGLFTVMPSDSSPGTEIGGSGYDRATIANTDSLWVAATTESGITSKTNAFPVTFPTAIEDWAIEPNPIVGYGLFTADYLTGGLLATSAALTTPKEIHSGETPSLGAGVIVVRAD